MLEAFTELNWLAVVIAAVAYYLFGALWFTPLFGTAWDTAIGHTREPGTRFPVSYYLVPLASSIMVTIAMAVIIQAAAVAGFAEALGIGILAGLGVAFAISVNNGLTPHTPHPFRFGAITGGYHAVGITMVSLILWLMGS